MKEIDIEKILQMNNRLLLLVGYMSAILLDLTKDDKENLRDDKFDWTMKAIENLIYLDKPLPPIA